MIAIKKLILAYGSLLCWLLNYGCGPAEEKIVERGVVKEARIEMVKNLLDTSRITHFTLEGERKFSICGSHSFLTGDRIIIHRNCSGRIFKVTLDKE